MHAYACASVHECVCAPVLLYFTGLCDCAPDIQSHTDGIHLTWKPGRTSSTSRHLLCLMHRLTLLQGCFFLPPWPWHLPSRPLIILSPRLRFYLSKTFDPVVSLRIEFDMWRRCLASPCCRVIFFSLPLKLPGRNLPSRDFTFDFAPTTLSSYYLTWQEKLCICIIVPAIQWGVKCAFRCNYTNEMTTFIHGQWAAAPQWSVQPRTGRLGPDWPVPSPNGHSWSDSLDNKWERWQQSWDVATSEASLRQPEAKRENGIGNCWVPVMWRGSWHFRSQSKHRQLKSLERQDMSDSTM